MSENGGRSQDSGLNSGADLKLVKIVNPLLKFMNFTGIIGFSE